MERFWIYAGALTTLVMFMFGLWQVSRQAIKDWNRKHQGTEMEIRFGPKFCPRCSRRLPMFRIPRSWLQVRRGGWTCGRCGCEVDRLGRERGAA